MKVFQLRDESQIGDILVQYLVTSEDNMTEEQFHGICKEYEDGGVGSVVMLAHLLVVEKGFVPLTVEGIYQIKTNDSDWESAYESLMEERT